MYFLDQSKEKKEWCHGIDLSNCDTVENPIWLGRAPLNVTAGFIQGKQPKFLEGKTHWVSKVYRIPTT